MDRIRYAEARADLVEHYKTTEDRDLGETEARLKHLDRFFASSRLVAITSDIVTRYASSRKDQGAANGTINRESSTLSKLLRLAAEHGKPDVRRQEAPRGRPSGRVRQPPAVRRHRGKAPA